MATSDILICSLGTGKYDPVHYRLADDQWQTRFAPVAVAKLRFLSGVALILATSGVLAKKDLAALKSELREAGVEPRVVAVKDGLAAEDHLENVETLLKELDEVPGGTARRLFLDVTFGFRSLPFIYLAAMTYLTGLGEAELGGVYYGEKDEARIVDITEVYRLTQWFHAAESATKSVDLQPLAQLLIALTATKANQGAVRQHLSGLKDSVARLSPVLAAGLPLETGLAARRYRAELEQPSPVAHAVHRRALAKVGRWLEDLASPGDTDKGGYPLSEEELQRQLRLARLYAERDSVPLALLLLREALVSLVILRTGKTESWLDYGQRRKPAENWLNRLADGARDHAGAPPLPKHVQDLAAVWQEVRDKRNALAHAGMNPKPTKLDKPTEVTALVAKVERCVAADASAFASSEPVGGRLLITPLGTTPGVLYTSIKLTQPDRVVVVTSREAAPGVGAALHAAGCPTLNHRVHLLADPFLAIEKEHSDRILDAADSELRRWIVDATEVVVNVTGGTTAMQVVVERIAAEVKRRSVPGRRIGLVDRRPRDEQASNPFVVGEVIDIERWADDQPAD